MTKAETHVKRLRNQWKHVPNKIRHVMACRGRWCIVTHTYQNTRKYPRRYDFASMLRLCIDVSMTPGPMVIQNHGYRGRVKLEQKMVPCTGHKPGQISSNKYFSTIFRTGILRSFFWKGSQVARKPGL